MSRSIGWALLLLIAGCKGCPGNDAEQTATVRPRDTVLVTEQAETHTGDLAQIKERGVLRALITGTGEDFLPRTGTPASLDRRLVRGLSKKLGVETRFVLVPSHDELIEALVTGKGDVIAAQLTATAARREKIRFARPLAVVNEVLVAARDAEGAPEKPEDLAGKTVSVAATPHRESLEALQVPELNIARVGGVDAEELVYRVGKGEIALTVCDSHTLEAIQSYNPAIRALFPIAEGREIAWAVRKDNPELHAAVDAFIVERAMNAHTDERSTGDMNAIRERGVLRVITRNNPVTYFLHRGRPKGFDFELAQMIADELGVRLEVVVPPSRDLLIPWLLEGRGDVIAASLTATPARAEKIAFSAPYLRVEEVVVQRKGGPKIALPEDLVGRPIHVRDSSSYRQTLEELAQTVPGLEIVLVPEEVETEELIGRVASGEIPLTVADSHILAVELAYRDDIEAAFTLTGNDSAWDDLTSGSKEIVFGIRPENPQLKTFLDTFVQKNYRGLRYNMARKRYFENRRNIAAAKTERIGASGRLSPYDELIKKYSKEYGLDWRLMAALAYQESRFDPSAKSWVGALGLFQLMPATAREMGFKKPEVPEQGVHAGIRYIDHLVDRFESTLPLKHRLRFAMASYNAGYGHVQDARRLAASMELDPDKWFDNAEKAMLLLEKPKYYRHARYGYCRGSEPVRYVSEIQNRYDNWVEVIKD